MKKLYLFLFTLVVITTASAQKSYHNDDSNPGNYNQRNDIAMANDRHSPSKEYGQYSRGNEKDSRYNGMIRRKETENLNREYDNKAHDYGNDRSMNQYDRKRRIAQGEKERGQKIKSFTGGVVVGALAGVLLGVLISGQ